MKDTGTVACENTGTAEGSGRSKGMFENENLTNGNQEGTNGSQPVQDGREAVHVQEKGQTAGYDGREGGHFNGAYSNHVSWQGNGGSTSTSNQAGSSYQNGQMGYGQSQGNYSGYGNYQSYHGNYQYGNGDYGTAPGRNMGAKGREKREKKKIGPFWKKLAVMAACGICFGLFAGVSFLAVNALGGKTEQPAPVQVTEGTGNSQASESALPQSSAGIKSTVTQGSTSAVVTDVTKVVEGTMPSIVSITNQSVAVASFWGQTFEQEQESAGSGIIIGQNDTELLVVTNNHVVADSNKLSVKFIDDEVVEAQIKGTSPSMDLAVIAVKLEDIESSTRERISVATMGDSDSLKVGEPVIAIGNALGYGQSVTTGVVSALNRTLEVSETGTSNALIQTDAAINPGNSGGALLDVKGQVIGINSNKIGGNAIEGMGYAIPISSAQPIIEELMNRETRELVDEGNRGYLGVSIINVTAAMAEAYGMPEGILIAQVYPATGAQEAGLLKGDIIVGFAGSTVTTQDDLANAMQYYAVGDVVELTIMRGNITDGYEEQKVSVNLTSQEAMNATKN